MNKADTGILENSYNIFRIAMHIRSLFFLHARLWSLVYICTSPWESIGLPPLPLQG